MKLLHVTSSLRARKQRWAIQMQECARRQFIESRRLSGGDTTHGHKTSCLSVLLVQLSVHEEIIIRGRETLTLMRERYSIHASGLSSTLARHTAEFFENLGAAVHLLLCSRSTRKTPPPRLSLPPPSDSSTPPTDNMPGVSVRDVEASRFIDAYAAFLKRQGKLPIPGTE